MCAQKTYICGEALLPLFGIFDKVILGWSFAIRQEETLERAIACTLPRQSRKRVVTRHLRVQRASDGDMTLGAERLRKLIRRVNAKLIASQREVCISAAGFSVVVRCLQGLTLDMRQCLLRRDCEMLPLGYPIVLHKTIVTGLTLLECGKRCGREVNA